MATARTMHRAPSTATDLERGSTGDAPTPPAPATEQSRVRLPRHMVRTLCSSGMKLLCRPRVIGVENVPPRGPFLLIFNHTSNFDPALIRWAVPRPDLVGLVAASYRARPLVRLLVEASGSIWLRRGAADRRALEAALAGLRSGACLGMSPEGGRSPGAAMRRGKPGAAFLALRTGVPVLPVGIAGAEGIHRGLARGRRVPVSVRIGRPFRVAAVVPAEGAHPLQQVVDEMMGRVAELVPPAYRGWYGGAP